MSTPNIRKRHRTWSPAAPIAPAPSSVAEPRVGSTTDSRASDAGENVEVTRVGHCRPPVSRRFGQPGGNRPGRKKGSKNRRTIFNEEMSAPVDVNGKKMEKIRLAMRQLANGMAKGDPKFLVVGLKLAMELDPARDAPPETVEVPLDTHEISAFDIMKQMFGSGGPSALRSDGSPADEGDDDE